MLAEVFAAFGVVRSQISLHSFGTVEETEPAKVLWCRDYFGTKGSYIQHRTKNCLDYMQRQRKLSFSWYLSVLKFDNNG
jgi:hypothetical protein